MNNRISSLFRALPFALLSLSAAMSAVAAEPLPARTLSATVDTSKSAPAPTPEQVKAALAAAKGEPTLADRALPETARLSRKDGRSGSSASMLNEDFLSANPTWDVKRVDKRREFVKVYLTSAGAATHDLELLVGATRAERAQLKAGDQLQLKAAQTVMPVVDVFKGGERLTVLVPQEDGIKSMRLPD